MISRLKIELLSDAINVDKSSLFQGVLMEQIDTDYASRLHAEGIRPYSQSLQRIDGRMYWVINTLNEEAHNEIISRLMQPIFDSVYIKHNKMDVKLGRKQYEYITYQQFADSFFEKKNSDGVSVKFITPTAFKRNGKYYNFPDMRLIYNSIVNKFNVFSGDGFDDSRELVERLVDITCYGEYSINSTVFRLEGTTVPSFTGTIGYRFNGDVQLNSLASMLFHYAEYCGVGTKTAIGMGSIAVNYKGE